MPRGAGAALLTLALAARVAAGEGVTRRGALDPTDLGYTYGPAPFAAEYTAPAPGTYALPVIDTVADHPLVDADGQPTSLRRLTGDRVAVIAFVYTSCVEAAGCPVSNAVFQRLDRTLAADPELSGRVTLVTISFDPERDTPAQMATMRRLHAPRGDWRFATTRDEAELAPLLADFGQPVAKLRFADGAWTGLYRHVLKVFLLDGASRVRNVYSVGFLNPELVRNDVRTVLLEATPAGAGEFTDPFAYCAALRDVDEPDARWVGATVPDAVAAGLAKRLTVSSIQPRSVSWRCMQGHVYACTVGTNIPCGARARTDRAPTEGMRRFCTDSPGADVIPAYAAGRETVYAWRCDGSEPAIVRQLFTPDARGFDPNVWHELAAEGP